MCMNNKFNVGEVVYTIPGFDGDTDIGGKQRYAGYGYREYLSLTITKINFSINKDTIPVYFFEEIEHGIYEFALTNIRLERECTIEGILYE